MLTESTIRKPGRPKRSVTHVVVDGKIVRDDTIMLPLKGTNTEYVPTPLTTEATRVMRFITRFHTANGFAPTHVEMQNALGIRSHSLLYIPLRELERKGYIRFAASGNIGRAMAVLKTVE